MNASNLGTPTLETIHQGLLRDYYAQLGEKNYEQQTLDPVLGTILRLFAARMETLYSDQQNVRLALLDELIRGLSVEPRHAIPAQAVIRFALPAGHAGVVLPEGSNIWYDGPEGEKLPFASDHSVRISSARIAMAFVYQNRFLRPCCVGQWAGPTNSLYPKQDSAPADWGDGTSLLLALDDLPEGSLDGLSLFFDTLNGNEEIRRMLARSMWRVADGTGRFGASGVYRPHPGRAGTMELHPAIGPHGQAIDPAEPPSDDIRGGSYSGLTFVFPEKTDFAAPAVCQRPFGLETAISRLFPPASIEVLNRERVWIRVSFVPEPGSIAMPALAGAFAQLILHAMSLSNLECRDQSPGSNRNGSSLPIEFPGAGRYLVGLRAIHAGRRATPIVPLLDSSAPEGTLRYTVRSGRIEVIVPPNAGSGEEVNIRVWTTQGDRGNDLPSVALQSEIQMNDGGVIKLISVKPPRGGKNQEDRSTAEARFASAILSRGRIVTQADLMAAVRAFDSRIVDVSATPVAVRRGRSLQTVERITVVLRSAEFPPSSETDELRCLRQELETGLRSRLPFDTDIEVAVQWDDTRPEEIA